ncbi:Formin-like protein 13, partial [Dictyocoela roeselum]
NSAASDALTKEKEIIVDIILFKIGTIKNIYESKTNIQMLIDDFENEIDPLKLKNLLSAGYDPNYSKIALMMHQNQPEVENFLEKKAENNIERDYLVAHKKETIEKSDPKISVSYREFCDSDVIKSRACLDARPFKSTTTEVFETLELLPDSIKVKKENVRKRMPILKKKMYSNEKVPKKLAKPFHWVATSSIPGSIFTEMESVKTEINFDLFERWFCGTKKQEEALFSQPLSSINDQKRLFLVSLSLKNLEKRSLETSRDFMKLSLEDLKLAQTIVPKNEEMSRFGENLSEIDEKMIKFKQFETLIDILIFERRFIINFSALENSLGLIEKAVHALNSSKRITKLFKTILDLGNCINYRYGTKYREFTAFKISTLNIIPQYKSRYKGYTLMSFLALTLRKDTDFREIFRELNPIYLTKNQDLGIVKERINEFIVLYEKYKPDLGGIDECVYNDIFSFFSYFYTCMKRFSDRYLSLLKAINDLKTRFNEDDKIKINEILKSMSDFLILLEGELL